MELIRVEIDELTSPSGQKFYRGKYEHWVAFGRAPYEILQQLHWQMRGFGTDWRGRKKVRKLWRMMDFL